MSSGKMGKEKERKRLKIQGEKASDQKKHRNDEREWGKWPKKGLKKERTQILSEGGLQRKRWDVQGDEGQ